jgi:probable addiction module antidote protein
MTEQFTRWDAADYLGTREEEAMYLDACAEADSGDGSLIRAALSDIARARNMTQLAKAAGMTREGLYKALSPQGNPSFASVLKVTHALGLELHITASPQP